MKNNTNDKCRAKYEGLEIQTLSGICKVHKYISANHIIVKFEDGTFVETNSKQVQTRFIKNPNKPSVYGVGFIGQGKYSSKSDKSAYNFWKRMLERCYCEKYLNKKPTYLNCTVVKHWHNFQNFATWFYEQEYNDGWELDKDLLVKDNKIYGPETCCFVPRELNLLIHHNKRGSKENPIGVFFIKRDNIFCSSCTDRHGSKVILGYSKDKEYLFKLYKEYKQNMIRQAAEEWRNLVSDKLYNSLINWEL